jgi:hypothetical protein
LSIRTTDEWIFLEPLTSAFHSAASFAGFGWVEKSSLLLLVVATRCCIFFNHAIRKSDSRASNE